jgi:hypothetical protein
MTNAQRVRLAGWCGIVGGVVYFVEELANRVYIPQADVPGTLGFAIGGVIATVAISLLLIGFLGLSWGGALGNRLGVGVFALAALGYALMIVGAVLTVAGVGPLTDQDTAVSLIYLLGRLIAVVFTLLTGVAVLAARRWQGWAAFAPLLLGVWPLVGEALPVLVTGTRPEPLLNAAWGLCGALLGLAMLAHTRSAQAVGTLATGVSR